MTRRPASRGCSGTRTAVVGPEPSKDLARALGRLQADRNLSEDEARVCLGHFLDGRAPPDLVVDLLTAMAAAGETVDEYVGFARALLDRAAFGRLPGAELDVCGTGGSGLSKFNVSTAAAFVLAAGGVRVAKQASRGSNGQGSFDLLQELDLATPLERAGEVFGETGLCFLEASALHPSACKLAPGIRATLRRSDGIFRYFMPLANPARPRAQIIGTSEASVAGILAEAARRLGRRRVVVAAGPDGLDEISPSGPTLLVVGGHGRRVDRHLVTPACPGLADRPSASGSTAPAAGRGALFLDVLSGHGPAPVLETVCLNAGAGFWCAGRVPSLRAGCERSRAIVESGAARRFVRRFRETIRRSDDGIDG